MLLHDRALYRKLLRRLTLAELLALYERTVCLYAPLAEAVSEELDSRLQQEAPPCWDGEACPT